MPFSPSSLALIQNITALSVKGANVLFNVNLYTTIFFIHMGMYPDCPQTSMPFLMNIKSLNTSAPPSLKGSLWPLFPSFLDSCAQCLIVGLQVNSIPPLFTTTQGLHILVSQPRPPLLPL